MVDDVALNHATARDVLQDTYELFEATSGKDAFRLLKEVNRGLVIDCCDKIRALNENSFCFPAYLLGI